VLFQRTFLNYLVGKKNGREHLLPEHAQAQANPWQVSWIADRLLCPDAASVLTNLPLSTVQGLFDLVNKILNEAGAANAHDVYINLYPASTGRLRPHQDGKQVKFTWRSRPSSLSVCCVLQSATFKVNIRFSNVASELLIWVSQGVRREARGVRRVQ
jgi:hypothetical protein